MIIKNLTLFTGIILTGYLNGISQIHKGWTIVTKEEFERRKINKNKIQEIDLTVNDGKSTNKPDPEKFGRTVKDNAQIFYWINLKALSVHGKENNGDFVEYDEDDLMKYNEFNNILKGFRTKFGIIIPYTITPQGPGIFNTNPRFYLPGESHAWVLKNIEGAKQKEVLVEPGENTRGTWAFLNALSETELSAGLCMMKFLNQIECAEFPNMDSKVAFLTPFFTDSIPDAIALLPEFIPEVIQGRPITMAEILKIKAGVNNPLKVNPEPVEKSVIEMTDISLAENLKEREK